MKSLFVRKALQCLSKPFLILKNLAKKIFSKKPKQAKKRKNRKFKEKKVSSITEEKIIQTLIELYKFNETFSRMLKKIPEEEVPRYQNKYQWFTKTILELSNSIGIQLRDFTGMDFDPGLPITVINLEDFDADDELVISQMVEPVILKSGKLIKAGSAIVKEKE